MDHPPMSRATLHVTPPWGRAARLHRPRAPEPMLGTWSADGAAGGATCLGMGTERCHTPGNAGSA